MHIVVEDQHRAAVLQNYRIARRELRKDPVDAIAWVRDTVYAHAATRELAAGDLTTAAGLAAYFAAAADYTPAAQRLRARRIDRIVARSAS